MKLEFGNIDHIDLLKQGVLCTCGHTQVKHGDEGCYEQWEDYDYDNEEEIEVTYECSKFINSVANV